MSSRARAGSPLSQRTTMPMSYDCDDVVPHRRRIEAAPPPEPPPEPPAPPHPSAPP